jgi:hypothetical protein
MNIEMGHDYLLRFQPRRTDDLKESHPAVGALVLVRAMFVLDSGPYVGEWAMQPLADDLPFWIPSGDLVPPTCDCPCHKDPSVMHIVPCCSPSRGTP